MGPCSCVPNALLDLEDRGEPAVGVPSPSMSRWNRWLSHPRMPWIAALVAVALCLPALAGGWQMDDYGHRMIMLRASGTLTEPMQVFASLPGDPELNQR